MARRKSPREKRAAEDVADRRAVAARPELDARVVHCAACDTYMEHGNHARTFTRAVLDAHKYELLTLGIGKCQHCPTVVERQGLDLNRYALEHILPGAVEMCDAGIEREKALERDKPAHEGRRVFTLAEVRGMPMQLINGVLQEPRGWFRTVELLPHMTQTLMGRNEAQIRFAYAMALQKLRVAKSHREALRMANGNAIRFVFVGGGVEVAT